MSSDPEIQRSPLHDLHLELGARMVPFAGWEMPIQYAGILAEHKAVRDSCGVFDISHMGQFIVSGVGAAAGLDTLLTNRVAALEPTGGQYTFMLNDKGGVIDDLIVYRLADGERYLLVVNASKAAEDAVWIKAHLPAELTFEDISAANGGLAVQGPNSVAAFTQLFGESATLPQRNHIAEIETSGESNFVCRTGYTGEDGFEIFGSDDSVKLWFKSLIENGFTPCGLGARDTLRLEMCYPLNGSDLSPERTPIEAGLGFFVDLEKREFTGRDILCHQKEHAPDVRLAAIKFDGKSPPPRPHAAVIHADSTVGELTSATLSPSLRIGIGMAYLPRRIAKVGTPVEIDIRGKKFPAKVVKKPFLKKP